MKSNKYISFKNRFNLQERKQKLEKHFEQNPTKIPMIIEPDANSKLPPFSNPRFCMAKEKDILYLKASLKTKIEQMRSEQSKSNEGIFFYTGKQLVPQMNESIQSFYERNKDQDGFLYITFSELEVF